ncbi:MAG: hypothetical protein GY696_30110 [Gammaproteobacteria bacterium]|nr:hypothetical protein [Gammaproteobacteria bacterium]
MTKVPSRSADPLDRSDLDQCWANSESTQDSDGGAGMAPGRIVQDYAADHVTEQERPRSLEADAGVKSGEGGQLRSIGFGQRGSPIVPPN